VLLFAEVIVLFNLIIIYSRILIRVTSTASTIAAAAIAAITAEQVIVITLATTASPVRRGELLVSSSKSNPLNRIIRLYFINYFINYLGKI
jgi:hypothetical protein